MAIGFGRSVLQKGADMNQFLAWLNAFNPYKDIGEAIPEAAAKVRCYEEELVFSAGGTNVFAPQELNPTSKPVIDLAVDVKTFPVSVYDTEGNLLRKKQQTRIIYQSDVGTPVGNPGLEYIEANTPAKRAMAQAKDVTFNNYKPAPCPWQGALVGLWHTAIRVCHVNQQDGKIKASNMKLILEVGNALRMLTRASGDNDNLIVRGLVQRLNTTKNPVRTLKAILKRVEYWIKNAGNDEELAAKEAEGCVEEFCREAKMTTDDIARFGALRLPSGKLIHMNNVVKKQRLSDTVRIGYSEDGDMGEILSYDEIIDREEDKAEAQAEENAANRMALSAGRNSTLKPILLSQDVHRPMVYAETQENVKTWILKVKTLSTKRERLIRIEGTKKHALWAADKFSANPRFGVVYLEQLMHPRWKIAVTDGYSVSDHDEMYEGSWDFYVEGPKSSADTIAHFIKTRAIRTKKQATYYRLEGLPRRLRAGNGDVHNLIRVDVVMASPVSEEPVIYQRTFGGSWNKRSDGTFVKCVGVVSSMLPLDISGVDHLSILRENVPGSGFSDDAVGCYVEQEGECTLVLGMDWVTENVEFSPSMTEMVQRIAAYGKNGRDASEEQRLRRDITVQFKGRSDRQRFLRGLLRNTIRDVMAEKAMSDNLMAVIKPMDQASLDTYHFMRSKVSKNLATLQPVEKRFGWSFINMLHDELRDQAIMALDKHRRDVRFKGVLTSFAMTRKMIRELQPENFGKVNATLNSAMFTMPSWIVFLLKDELSAKYLELKALTK
jgi:hypothetical protein